MAVRTWGHMGSMLCDNAESVEQRQVLDALPALVFLEREGRIVFANAEALEVMGLAERDWQNRPMEELIWGLSAGRAEPQTILTSRKGRAFHGTLVAQDGELVPLEGTYHALHADGREGVIVAHLSTRQRASRTRLMEEVLACIPEALAIVLGGNVMYTNPAFSRMFGYVSEEVAGEDLQDLIVPETRQDEHASLEQMVEDCGIAALDTVRRTKDGELVGVALQMAPLTVSGMRAGFVLSFRDINERHGSVPVAGRVA